MTLQISPHEVHIFKDTAGNKLNPRGRLVDTVDLEESIKSEGQIRPVVVVKYNDKWYLMNGERRLNACRKLGIAITAMEYIANPDQPLTEEFIVRYMFSTNVTEKFPVVTLDINGDIVGGVAMGFKRLKDKGMNAKQIQPIIGLKYNVTLGLEALFEAHVNVRKAVEAGTLGLSNVSLYLKAFPAHEQNIILEFARKRGAKESYSRENLKNTIEWLMANNWGNGIPESEPTEQEDEMLDDLASGEEGMDYDLPDSPSDSLREVVATLNKIVLTNKLTASELINLQTIQELADSGIRKIKKQIELKDSVVRLANMSTYGKFQEITND